MVSRRARTALLSVLAGLVGIAAIAVAAAIPADQRSVASSEGGPALTDDDGGSPLFEVPALAPGERLQRCIRVRYRGDADASVGLTADVAGPLADHTSVMVEAGRGGGFGSCDGFDGEVVFRGTFARAESGLADARRWQARSDEAHTYRFTVAASDTLPEAPSRFSADIAWRATGGDDASRPPEPPTTPPNDGAPAGDPPGPAPPPDPPPGETPANPPPPEPTRDASGSTPPGSRAKRHASRADPGGREAQGGVRTPGLDAGTNDDDKGGVGQTVQRALDAAARAAVEAAKRGTFPLLLLGAMLLFIAVQNRIDARDPKLALAPIFDTPDVPFEPPPGEKR